MLDFKDDDVKRIFTLRSKGKSQRDIGKLLSCSDNSVAKVLRREIYSEVEVPENILLKCADMRAAPKTRTVRKKSGCVATSLAAYTAACQHLTEAKRDCLKFGVDENTLELLREAVRDNM